MALQNSPPISLNDIKSEFGATGTRRLTEFYRGGPFVPNIPENSSVPTSGPISVLDFLGATNYVPLDGDRSPIGGDVFIPEPAPVQTSVSATGAAGATGGTGSYTYVWTILSGGAAISGSNTNASVLINATVPKNGTVSGTIRCQISDGVTSINIDRAYALSYTTDL